MRTNVILKYSGFIVSGVLFLKGHSNPCLYLPDFSHTLLPVLFWNHVSALADVFCFWAEFLSLPDCRFWFVKMAHGVHVTIARGEVNAWGRDNHLHAARGLWFHSKITSRCKAWYIQVLYFTIIAIMGLIKEPLFLKLLPYKALQRQFF